MDALVPILDRILSDAGEAGTFNAVIGMAHRGGLNVLAHIVGIGYDAVLSEFEAAKGGAESLALKGGSDDVKYHLGAEGSYTTPAGREIRDHAGAEPKPSRGGRPGGGGARPSRADGPIRADRARGPQPHAARS